MLRRKLEGRNYDPDHGCINDSSDGSYLYLVGLWPGHGYRLETMLVWARDEYEAMDIAAEWASENAKYITVPDDFITSYKEDAMADMIRKDPGKYIKRIPSDFDDLDSAQVCRLLRSENADLFYDTMYEIEDTQAFQETFRIHDKGIYTWGREGKCERVDPADFSDIVYADAEESCRRCEKREIADGLVEAETRKEFDVLAKIMGADLKTLKKEAWQGRIIIGRLSEDPHIEGGKCVITVVNDAMAEDCAAGGKLKNAMMSRLHKGDLVCVETRLGSSPLAITHLVFLRGRNESRLRLRRCL